MAGESFLQLVVPPEAPRKHVLNLGHDVFGGPMAVKRTKEQTQTQHDSSFPALYDSSVYQFNVDGECLNDGADDVDMNACAVVYTSDREFAELEPIPTSLTTQNCHDLPSTKIDPDAIKHLTKSQQSELLDLLDCYSECFADVP